MKISIIIPNYNTGKYLETCLDSIYNQTYKDFEVIVVDAYSTDCSGKIFEKMLCGEHSDKFFLSFVKPSGQSDAINKGMELAQGDIVAYLCADDTYEYDCFALVNSAFECDPEVQWVYGRGKIIDEYGRETRNIVTRIKELFQPENSHIDLQCIDYIVQPTVFLKRSFYKTVGKFNTNYKYCMDYDYWLRARRLSKPMFINQHLANWRSHKESTSVKGFENQTKEAFEIQKNYSGWWLRPFQVGVYLGTNILYRNIS